MFAFISLYVPVLKLKYNSLSFVYSFKSFYRNTYFIFQSTLHNLSVLGRFILQTYFIYFTIVCNACINPLATKGELFYYTKGKSGLKGLQTAEVAITHTTSILRRSQRPPYMLILLICLVYTMTFLFYSTYGKF